MTTSFEQQIDTLLNQNINQIIEWQRVAFDQLAGDSHKSIVIFGASFLGKLALRGLRQLGIEPLAFADNNQTLWNQLVEGLPVLPPQEASTKFGKTAVFIVAVYNGSILRQQLVDLNCQKVVSYAYLFAKYPEVFLPHFALDLPYEIYKQASDVRQVATLWADNQSRQQYLANLRWRLFLDFDKLATPIPQSMRKEEYFPKDIYTWLPNEVFIDCGAFDGDTIKRFLEGRKYQFERIIGLEPDPDSFQKLQAYVSTLPENIREKFTLIQAAIGTQREKLNFEATASLMSVVSSSGTIEVDCVPLDDVLDNCDCVPSLIKMDLEGFELNALAGASRTIAKASAVLVITVYHCQDHLWRIPLFIHSLSSEYRFFLRPHAEEWIETSLYAVPVNRLTT